LIVWDGVIVLAVVGGLLGLLEVKEVAGGFMASHVDECGDTVLVVGLATFVVEAAVLNLAPVPL